jgi:hypothetical protein
MDAFRRTKMVVIDHKPAARMPPELPIPDFFLVAVAKRRRPEE